MINYWYDEYYTEMLTVIDYAKLCYERGLTSAVGGNISFRCREGVIITASNTCFNKLSPQSFIMVSNQGEILQNPYGLKPSKEMHMHLGVFEEKPWVNCVMHLHPTHLIALTSLKDELPIVTESAAGKLHKVPVVPPETPGTMALADKVRLAVREADDSVCAIALADHGLITFSSTIDDAFYAVDLAEDNAKVAIYRKLLGTL